MSNLGYSEAFAATTATLGVQELHPHIEDVFAPVKKFNVALTLLSSHDSHDATHAFLISLLNSNAFAAPQVLARPHVHLRMLLM